MSLHYLHVLLGFAHNTQDGLIDYKIHGPERQILDGDFDSHGNTITSFVVSTCTTVATATFTSL
jgi:hypothetical protein